MRHAVRGDLKRSAKAFESVVWPQIKDWFGGGDLVPVEAVTDSKMAKALDLLAGIDAWHVHGAVRGIASRIQWVDKAYDTFTVRMERSSGVETEFAKRLRAIESDRGWLYPHVTVQAYLSHQDELLSVAACRTADLIRYIKINLPTITMRMATDKTDDSQATFAVVPWLELKREHEVKIK